MTDKTIETKEKSEALKDADEQWEKETAEKPEPPPEPIEIKPKKIVKGTKQDATLIVCQCGKTAFTVSKRTATAVALKCADCSHEVSVKGPVAITSLDEEEVSAAVLESVISPDPNYRSKTQKDNSDDSDSEQKEKTHENLRFSYAIADRELKDRALGVGRLQAWGRDDACRGQAWQGRVLAFIFADFLSGADPDCVAHYDEIQDEIRELSEELKKSGTKKTTVTRKVRDRNHALYEKAAIDMGIFNPEEKRKTSSKKKPTPPENKVDDERIPDDDRLSKCVKSALIAAAEDYRERTGNTLSMLLGVSMNNALEKAQKEGGFVVEVRGDERTRDGAMNRPTMVVWFEKEVQEFKEVELPVDYADEYEIILPSAEIQVIEIVPADDEVGWEMPAMCTGREER